MRRPLPGRFEFNQSRQGGLDVRRRKRRSRVVIPLVVVVIGAVGAWWLWPRGDEDAHVSPDSRGDQPSPAGAGAGVPEAIVSPGGADTPSDEVLTPVGSTEESPAAPESAAGEDVDIERPGGEPEPAQAAGAREYEPAAGERDSSERLSQNPRIDASLKRYQSGEVIAARQELNRMLVISRNPAEQVELRRHLEKIADATVFSREQRADDPLTTTYTIQPGDVLINVGRQFDVPHEVIMLINGIQDATRIRAGQKIKVPRGPFHVKIYKSKFRLDVYLQDLFVRSFPVGLGVDDGTPEGTWKVKDRLTNPTYYPPASAEIKRRIPADDPTNPLGEHWLGLEGIEGDAVGRVGYGIHGTIEPESIGKQVSLGCIRMHNKDVEFLYKLMMPGSSTVTTLP
jgi:LysM repeat protein